MKHLQGLVFGLHRKEKHRTLDFVTSKSHITIFPSKLSDFETGKCFLGDEVIEDLYQTMDMEYHNNEIDKMEFRNLFYQFYDDILLYQDSTDNYRKLCKMKDRILTTVVYPQFLLVQLLHAAFYVDPLFDYNTAISQIDRCFECLDDNQKQIYYDTLGIYYQDQNQSNQAFYYFDKASVYGYEPATAMMLYHKSETLILNNQFMDALECIDNAQQYFTKQLNFNRILLCSGTKANVYRRVGAYDKAISIYKECISHMDIPYLENDLLMAYNNLSWTYLLSGQYIEAIENAKLTIKRWKTHVPSYFFLSYCHERLGKEDKAKNYILKARDNMIKYVPTDYMRSMVEAFYTYLSSQKPMKTKLKKLEIALKEAVKTNNLETEVFVLKIIIELLQHNNEMEGLISYQTMLIECYEKRK